MAHYLIEAPHTPEQCLQALDELADETPELLDKMWFGCGAGQHVGWAFVDAQSEIEARSMLPDSLQPSARITQVARHSAQQIRAMHKKAA